jgi:glycosyltransferase involved in cell wall biosynthesis
MTIYLSAEVVSGLGEETFWLWFKKEFPSSVFGIPDKMGPDDVVLRYSTLGPATVKGRTIALLWELHPEMKKVLGSNKHWDIVISKIDACARESTHRVLASEAMAPYYESFGSYAVLPIGVDTELFKPSQDKQTLKKKYGLEKHKKIVFWCGTSHPMKGYNTLVEHSKTVKDEAYIVVWKDQHTRSFAQLAGPTKEFTRVSQQTLSELMACSDVFACTGRLKPFFMVEWEAQACGLPFIMLSGDREFTPSGREGLMARGWDRKTARDTWAQYLSSLGVRW